METFLDQLCKLPGQELIFPRLLNSTAEEVKAYVEERTDKTVTVLETHDGGY